MASFQDRKNPEIVIRAIQFYVDNMPDWFFDRVTDNIIILHNCDYKRYSIKEAYCEVKTKKGIVRCNGGDYVILNEDNTLVVVGKKKFEKTYKRWL